jgi:predicted nucleic acid-binding protein
LILVDANVLLDVVTADPVWCEWSIGELEAAGLEGALAINEVVYAELAVRYDNIEQLDALMSGLRLEIAPMPRAALFLAAKAFSIHRNRGGTRSGVLPDFFIGAQAAVLERPLITRDRGRYETYFPTIRLIAPAAAS